jgi:Flp pilus assembly protein TadG
MRAQHKRSQRGGAVFEFAMLLPLISILFLGIIDFSRAMLAYNALTHASEAAARFASVRSRTSLSPATTGSIRDRVLQAGTGLEADKVAVIATWTPGNIRGGVVNVEIDYPYEPLTPFVPWDTITLTGSASARISN